MDSQSKRRALCRELVFDVACSAGEVRLRVIGASMLPAVWPDDVVTVQRCELAEFRAGQIVVYQQEEKLVIHRVECVSGDHLMTRGDSRPHFDPPVLADEIVGRVVSISRGGRSVDLERTFWRRLASSILRRSDFCTRVTLYLHRRLWSSEATQVGDLQASREHATPVPTAKV